MKIPFLLSILFFTTFLFSTIINVPADQPTIQAGIDTAVTGDTVLVAEGTYTGMDNRNLTWFGKILTVRSTNGPEQCVIDCLNSGRGFLLNDNFTTGSVIDGFTIVNGNSPDPYSGGIHCDGTTITIENCAITNNSGSYGGGISCRYGNCVIVNCRMSSNFAYSGGGVFSSYCELTIINCLFISNTSSWGGGSQSSNGSPTFINCTFSGNSANVGNGGAIRGGTGTDIINCILWGDSEEEIRIHSDGILTVKHSLVEGGEAGINGGQVSWLDGNLVEDPMFNRIYSLSKDKILFSSNRDGNFEIYSMDIDGSNIERLTNDSAIDTETNCSLNGNLIAFTSYRDNNGEGEIYVMNPDGSNLRRLTNQYGDDSSPSLSPNAERITFKSERTGMYQNYIMNLDGTDLQQLTNSSWNYGSQWSPNGEKLAFTSYRDNNFEVYSMNPDGTEQICLTNSPGRDAGPFWSPDGSQIVFASARDGNREVYKMNHDGTEQQRLTNQPGYDQYPRWSIDGNFLAFESEREGNKEIHIMRTDGTGQINLTENPSSDRYPIWLSSMSPCIDAGTPDTTGLNLPDFDILGNDRIVDGDGDGFAYIDMGAFEVAETPTYVHSHEPIIHNSSSLLFELSNYPNPFNPTTTINYSLQENSKVTLNIYNIKGQKVKQLVSNQLSAGQHSVIWNGKDENNKSVSSGIYFYKLKTENFKKTKRMILLK